jgi:hypothetical protein
MGLINIINFFFPKKKKNVPWDGMVAYEQGFELSDNPYPKNTPDFLLWHDDWLICAGKK